jgi:hypothetical protein
VKLEAENEAERYLLGRCGYGLNTNVEKPFILLARLSGDGVFNSDPYRWGILPRTMFQAHKWLQDHFDEIESGAVIDVEYFLGETKAPKLAERIIQMNQELKPLLLD